jgi:hypothetical protein
MGFIHQMFIIHHYLLLCLCCQVFVYVASNSFVFVRCLCKEIFVCLFAQIAWVNGFQYRGLKGITFNGGSVEDNISYI